MKYVTSGCRIHEKACRPSLPTGKQRKVIKPPMVRNKDGGYKK